MMFDTWQQPPGGYFINGQQSLHCINCYSQAKKTLPVAHHRSLAVTCLPELLNIINANSNSWIDGRLAVVTMGSIALISSQDNNA